MFSPAALSRTRIDAMYVLLVIPLAEGLDDLRSAAVLPTIISIY